MHHPYKIDNKIILIMINTIPIIVVILIGLSNKQLAAIVVMAIPKQSIALTYPTFLANLHAALKKYMYKKQATPHNSIYL